MKGSIIMISLMLFLTSCTSLNGAGDLVIKGSTTVLPIVQAAAEAYTQLHQDLRVSVSGGGSGEGIKAVLDGTAQIATSSREVKPSESALAAQQNVSLVSKAIAIDCVVPVVHSQNLVKDLTIAQLKSIYTGKIRTWREVGGEDKPIIVVSRDTSSGTYEVWQELVLDRERVTPKALMQASNGAVVQLVSKNRYALGYISLGYGNPDLTLLKLAGIQATAETVADGTYPIARNLYVLTKGEPKGQIKDFLDFLVGPQGQTIVNLTGFLPLIEPGFAHKQLPSSGHTE